MKVFGMKISKTKVIAGVTGLLVVLQAQGVVHIDPKQFESILTLLGAGGLYSLRDAVGK
jgi:hypothetical protein